MVDVAAREARFWSYVDRSDPDGCWLWRRAQNPTGYGVGYAPEVIPGNGVSAAHRIAFFFRNGYMPMVVRHRCPGGPNPLCCNPDHLRGGTHADNMRDKAEDGNQCRGSTNGNAVLTDEIVAEARRLRAQGLHARAIAERLGVNVSPLKMAIIGRTWTHVSVPPVRTGNRVGSAASRARLNEDQVREARRIHAAGGVTVSALARRYEVPVPTMEAAVNRRTWRHLD